MKKEVKKLKSLKKQYQNTRDLRRQDERNLKKIEEKIKVVRDHY